MSEETSTAGWDAIDHALAKIYGKQEPKHYGTMIPYALGGDDPLDGISAYKADSPYPHWHFITYGFSELYDKESDHAAYSGYGFELTFRLARQPEEEEPPAWALNLLQNMGRYVFNSGNVFRSGDYLDANGPICLGSDTQLTALAFMQDLELPAIDTPNGRLEFIQMIGITKDELEAMQAWNTLGLLNASQSHLPFYITNLDRDSLLCVPEIVKVVERGMQEEGSNTGFLFVQQLGWESGKNGWLSNKPAKLLIGAKQAAIIGKLIQGRVLKRKELTLVGSEVRIVIKSSDHTSYETIEDEIQLFVDDRTAAELSAKLQPKAGVIELASVQGIVVQIEKTEIKDQEGNVVEVIG
ncbi:suppressor of fused domain protein [Paenibacillus alvei]|uniref:Suppressor of fused domain protein n=1 Tax=Paenibacillus alvei TaxID=44250 RepID=A0ABT4GWM8_PAEAL|nr:suppressor of fused domain protein [Paenibacillus alvei]MCY7484101.1 suppressor of fused domain protein [Paenibacillus alvei]MCY9760812.1 suppressor of fused domain protein [Paenibacillus alvei]MCY9769037.1 suppressor of fused domain protein [Paenibacillus alvei]